jgi:hypothetical protein
VYGHTPGWAGSDPPGQPGTRTLRGDAPSGWVEPPHPAQARIIASSNERAMGRNGIGSTYRGTGLAGVRDHTHGAPAVGVGGLETDGTGVRDRARGCIG